MKKKILIIGLILILIAGAATCYRFNKNEKPKVSAIAACTIKSEMRKLWTDHAVYTREVIACLVDKAPGKDQAIDRLLRNQDDIGKSVEPYYGENAGKELARLLRIHIVEAADVVVAARDGNAVALKTALDKWYVNADDIAKYLVKANPKLDYADTKYMMDYHLQLTTKEVVSRIGKNYSKNIEDYDKVYYAILEMSDMISDGIVKQFPEKFGCSSSETPHNPY